jgi:MFS family permease
LLAACTVPLGYIDSYTLVLGLGAVSGLATGAGSGSLNALIADMSEPGHAARDMNWLFTAAATAQTLLNLVGGSLLTGYVRHGDTSEAYRALYIITAAIMVASLLPLWMISSRGSDRDAANSMARKPMQSSLMPRAHGAIEHGGGGGGYALDRLPHGAALCDWVIFGGSSSSQHNRKSHRYVS